MSPGEELTPGRLAISARSEQVGDNVGEIDATIEGEAAKIAFNGRYLIDKAIKDSTSEIFFLYKDELISTLA